MVNVEFLNKKKKQYIKNFTTFFIAIKLANFYQFSSKSTTNIIFFFLLTAITIDLPRGVHQSVRVRFVPNSELTQ